MYTLDMNSNTISRKCKIQETCKHRDSTDCVDIPNGCILYYNNMEEAENPQKSRRYFKFIHV